MRNFKNGFSNNLGLFALAEKSKVHRNVFWFVILACLIMFLGAIPTETLNYVINHFYNLPEIFNTTVFTLILGFGSLSLITFGIVKYSEKRSIRDLGFFRENWIKKYFSGFAIGLLFMCGSALVIYLLGGYSLTSHAANLGFSKTPTILFILLGWIIQSGTEEVVTRGWMLPLLGRKYNVPFAIIISSSLFAILHIFNGHISVIPLVNLFLYGIFAALFVIYTKDLWRICGLHAAWNWAQGNLLGVEVSGQDIPGGAFIKLSAQGNDLISGGEFGVEGSLVCSLLLLVLSTYLILKLLKRKETQHQQLV